MSVTALLPVRTAAPGEPLLTVAVAKEHLHVEHSADDDYIEALIAAVEAHLDGFAGILGRALVTQTWERSFDGFPCGYRIALPLGPMQAVNTVMYYDRDGGHIVLGASKYHAVTDAMGPCIILADQEQWPDTAVRPDAVTVNWDCGYGDAADVPAAIVQAAKKIIGHWYHNREAVVTGAIATELPLSACALLAPFRQAYLG